MAEKLTATGIGKLTRAAYLRDPAAFKELAIPHLLIPAVQAVAHGCAGSGPFEVGGTTDWDAFFAELEAKAPQFVTLVRELVEKHTSARRPGKPQRWAVRIAMDVAAWTGQRSETSIVLKLVQDYGLRDESEIRARLDLAGKVQTLGLEEAVERATDLLERVFAADPRRRAAVLTRLTRGTSTAEIEEGERD